MRTEGSAAAVRQPPTQERPCNRPAPAGTLRPAGSAGRWQRLDRKSTRLNSSHVRSSYAVFCLKKKQVDQKRHAGEDRSPQQRGAGLPEGPGDDHQQPHKKDRGNGRAVDQRRGEDNENIAGQHYVHCESDPAGTIDGVGCGEDQATDQRKEHDAAVVDRELNEQREQPDHDTGQDGQDTERVAATVGRRLHVGWYSEQYVHRSSYVSVAALGGTPPRISAKEARDG